MGERLPMRRLIYVPIIHSEADLGGLAEGIEERAKAVVGGINWQRHKDIVGLYWQRIADYWEGRDVLGCKIFQDAMVINGAVGENIVRDLANSGSINYKIVEQLLARGAKLVKTEDSVLLREEYFLARKLAERKPLLITLQALLHYKWRKGKILKARDAYIVKSINKSLEADETGICFLGAYHQILPDLPKDIRVISLKDPQKVKAYSQKFMHKKWESEANQLGEYLITPIERKPGEPDEQ